MHGFSRFLFRLLRVRLSELCVFLCGLCDKTDADRYASNFNAEFAQEDAELAEDIFLTEQRDCVS